MKERRDVAMLKESSKTKDVNGTNNTMKEEVKEEPRVPSACNTPDTKPPSNMANGDGASAFRSSESMGRMVPMGRMVSSKPRPNAVQSAWERRLGVAKPRKAQSRMPVEMQAQLNPSQANLGSPVAMPCKTEPQIPLASQSQADKRMPVEMPELSLMALPFETESHMPVAMPFETESQTPVANHRMPAAYQAHPVLPEIKPCPTESRMPARDAPSPVSMPDSHGVPMPVALPGMGMPADAHAIQTPVPIAGTTGTKTKGKRKKNTPKSEDSNKNKNVSEGTAKVKEEENGGPHSVGSENKKSPAGPSSGMGGGGGGATPGVVPPPTTQQQSGAGTHFSQNQSTVYVFPTDMANAAALEVGRGKCESLIAFHKASPVTQQQLAELQAQYPGKMGPGGPGYPNYPMKPGTPGMPGDIRPGGPGDMRPGGDMCPRGPGDMRPDMMGPGSMGGMPVSSGSGLQDVASWVNQQNLQMESSMAGYPGSSSGMGPSGPGNPMYSSSMGGPMPPNSMSGPGFNPMMDSLDFNIDNFGGGTVSMPNMNLSVGKIPDENLTLEQVRHRSEKLGHLNKIKGQFMEAGYLDNEHSPPFNASQGMTAQQTMLTGQQAMLAQQQAMLGGGPGGPGGGPSPHPMMSQQQFMLQQQQMRMEGGPYPPGHPGNFRGQGPMHNMQAQHEWMRMTSEYYQEKRMMGGPPVGPHGNMNGPPPPYNYSMTGGKRMQGPMMMGSPTSPPHMGPGGPPMMEEMYGGGPRGRLPMPMDPGMDGMGPGYGPGGMPPHSMGGMGMMPGMDGPMMPGMPGPGMSPHGPMVPAGMIGPGGPRMPLGPGNVNVVSSTGGRGKLNPQQVTLHRAGNPEQFVPDTVMPPVPSSGSSKPPPPYGQTNKRKRGGAAAAAAAAAAAEEDDPYKNLQPTPSPTQLSYLHQFEGQELTITKQLNTAYRENNTGMNSNAPSGPGSVGATSTSAGGNGTPHHETSTTVPSTTTTSSSHRQQQQQQQHPNAQFSSPAPNNAVHSPMPHNNNPPSIKNPLSNSSQTSSHMGSPATVQQQQQQQQQPPSQGQHPNSVGPPGPSPMSGANVRLTHYDPPNGGPTSGPGSVGGGGGGGGMSSAPATPTAGGMPLQKQQATSSSHLTSHNLEAMSKHVETLTASLQSNQDDKRRNKFSSRDRRNQKSKKETEDITKPRNRISEEDITETRNQTSEDIVTEPRSCRSEKEEMDLEDMVAMLSDFHDESHQGGVYSSIQIQPQVGGAAGGPGSNNGSNPNNPGSSGAPGPLPGGPNPQQQQGGPRGPHPGQQHPGPPHPGQPHGMDGNPNPSTQFINNTNINQINNYYMEQKNGSQAHSTMDVHMGPDQPPVSMSGGVMGPNMPMNGQQQAHHMQQQQHASMMMQARPGGMGVSMSMSQAQAMGQGGPGGMPPTSMSGMTPPMKSPPYSMPNQHPHPHGGPMPPHPSMHQGSMAGSRLTSPPFSTSSVGNASVHIQPKAPNTIQYLPANPPPTQQPPSSMSMSVGGPPPAKRAASELEMLARYSPMDLKGGNPTSTLQYFPGSPPNMRPHPTGSAGLPPNGPMDFGPQQSMEMQQAMMMRGGPGGPGPDYMGPMGQGMHPGMNMGPVPNTMGMDMGPMGNMDPMMMGPSPSAMRQVSALGPGGSGPMDPGMSSMMGPGGPQPGYPGGGGPPGGYMPNGQAMMMGQGPMSGPSGPGGMPMSHGMSRMPGGPQMRMGGMPGGSGGGYGPGYQQFQQQLYTQGRPRQMGPMMGGGPPGQYGMGMMPPNMPGPS